ncbi:MAG: hypothetical protein U9M98_00515 [Patescibacteria group bacterium]|nr:hypothetical protein [Patescibacteria group bacterium]
MNEYLLSLAGFTPEEWRSFRSRVLERLFLYWRKVSSVVTLERIKKTAIVLIVLGAFLLSIRVGSRYLLKQDGEESSQQAESPTAVEIHEPALEATLEELERQVQDILKIDSDYLYPTLDFRLNLTD